MPAVFNQRFWTGWSFLVLGLLTAVLAAALLAFRLVALERWMTLQGIVMDAVVTGSDPEYGAAIGVRWDYKNIVYSKTFSNWGQGSSRETYERIVSRYRKGSLVPLLCNPGKPSQVFLNAGYTPGFLLPPTLFILFGLAFAVTGFFIKPVH